MRTNARARVGRRTPSSAPPQRTRRVVRRTDEEDPKLSSKGTVLAYKLYPEQVRLRDGPTVVVVVTTSLGWRCSRLCVCGVCQHC